MKLLLPLLLFSVLAYSQEKKTIDHTVYNSWNSISAINQSRTGKIITYEINPHQGDGNLYVENPDGSMKKTFARGKSAKINYDESFLVFNIKPEFDTLRELKLDKVKSSKLPKDTLGIYLFETDSLITIPKIKSYKISKEGNWVAYLSQKDERLQCPEKKCRLFKKKNKCERPETSGTTLHLIDPISGKSAQFDQVKEYGLSKDGKALIYIKSLEGDKDTLSLHYVVLESMEEKVLIDKQLSIRKTRFDYNSEQLVFLTSADTNERKNYDLYTWNNSMENPKRIVDSTTAGLPEGHTVSGYFSPYFSRDGKKIFLGTNTILTPEPEDTLLESEKAKVDVWGSNDLRIQPEQLRQLKRDKSKSFMAVYHLGDNKLVQLEDETIESVNTIDHGNADFALSFSSVPYQRSKAWEFPWKRDVYYTDLSTGTSRLLKTAQGYGARLTPSGNHLVWYEGADSNWYAQGIDQKAAVNLTATIDDLFASDVNGNPFVPFPEGSDGWIEMDNTEYLIVYSRNDVWALCPSQPNKSFSVTDKKGQTDQITYRLNRFDYDSTYMDLEAALMHGVNEETKAEAYYSIEGGKEGYTLTERIKSDHKYMYVLKAEESDRILFRRMSFTDYPELEATNLAFESPKALTHANPQQEEYNWGTVEMVSWNSFEGRELKGLLYKPEDFDSTKSYPMIAYFYEKSSQNLHSHYSPKPTASIVYPTEYVSNGYIIFIPDVEYTPGHPAASAYDCIVSGTDYLTRKHSWIDSTRLGLQGQSWGGYQTAQLITMTTKYSAAMAGAPVSNMFSAYGGIRWGSGLSRMFQYERTQSRIGYTIWEKPELYIENSPIFGLPQVKTPLLIMHNDGDGAVPWYQGIELYMGLRRLDMPVWMLNYNGDEHNLMRNANRFDLSIRMRQFFDYYLLGKEIPVWMDEGVPAVNKGKDYGLDLKN